MINWLSRHKLLILLLIFVYAYYFLAYHQPHHQAIQQAQEVQGVKTNVTLFEEPEAGREPILTAINNAKQSVHVEVYLLSDQQIIDALIAKKAEGLDVKVMLEEHPFGGGKVNVKSKAALVAAQVSVQFTNPSYALTHEKSIIIDGNEVFILNQNLTTSAFDKNREYDVIDDNLSDAQEVERIFEADWNRTEFTPGDSNLVLSPINSRAKLASLIMNAASEIDLEMEVITDREMLTLLENKSKTAKVMVIIPDFKKIAANEKSARALEDSGIDVRTISSPYIHAKLIISDDSKAYVGSINFTSQSMDDNRELGIILSELGVLQKLTQSFDSDWSQAVDYK